MNERKFIILDCATCIDGQQEKDQVVYGSGVSDGYHTMEELYDHRRALNIALFHALDALYQFASLNIFIPKVYKARNHHPKSDPMFEGYFIVFCVGLDAKQTTIWTSYHYDLKYWDDFKIREATFSPPYPFGHIPGNMFFEKLGWRY